MKLLTLNTHSLIEEDYHSKLRIFVDAVSIEKPDIIALQEVNQTFCMAEIPRKELKGYCPCNENTVIRDDNHVFNAVKMLNEMDINYFWTYLPIKCGYDKYDEGLALMSLGPIIETDTLLVSNTNDYNNWKRREIIGIRTQTSPDEWFYSVHYGWWSDSDEPFQKQWERTDSHMKKYKKAWLMGDFNNSAEVHGEGYDMIAGSLWHDSYLSARSKDSGITVEKVIDGWHDKTSSADGMRIDQIWSSHHADIKSSKVIFNGKNYPVISDHYGIMVNY